MSRGAVARSSGTPARSRLVDVAERSGVTKSIVSRLLNSDPSLKIRPETRRRILKAADDLGYKPHAGARALARWEARALALLIPDLTNPVYSQITRGAYRRARDLGYTLLLAEDDSGTGTDDDQVTAFADLVTAGRVDGLLVASARPGHPMVAGLESTSIPYVFINREVPGSSRNVGMDMPGASRQAVDYLYAHGHERIGLISGPADLEPAKVRERGFRDRASELGLSECPIVRGTFSEAGGARACTELLTNHPHVTALYASTLGQAIGAMSAARQLGLAIPEQVSIIAYDDLPLAEFLDPPLTTISMPLLELGAAGVDALIDQIAGNRPVDVTLDTAPAIIERASVATVGTARI